MIDTSDIDELDDDEKHLPELLLRVSVDDEHFWPKLMGLFIGALSIQALQYYSIMRWHFADDVVESKEIHDWVENGLMEWKHGTNVTNRSEDVDFMSAVRSGTIRLTSEGYWESSANMFIGMVLLVCYQVQELCKIYLTNKYHFEDRTVKHSERYDKTEFRLTLAWIVLLGQIAVLFLGAFGGAKALLNNNSLDAGETIESSIAAFCVLEMDDQLLRYASRFVLGAHCFVGILLC